MIVFFVLALGITWGGRLWRVACVEATVQQQQEAVVSEALVYIEADFTAMQQALLNRAKALAETPAVIEAMRQRNLEGQPVGDETLVRFFANLDVPSRFAVELYDPSLELVAWNGPGLPLDEAPEAPRFLESFQTAIAEDSDWRQALVIWYPVRDDVRALGAVRLMQLLQARTPVQNQYLRDYSIGEVWQRSIRLPVHALFERPFQEEAPAQGQARLFQGLDGTILGRVVVEPPPPDQLIDITRRRFDDVLAFWTTLLLFWLMAGLWTWHRTADASAATTTRRRTGLRAGGRFALVAVLWWSGRYALLVLDVPARWQRGKAPLASLFDPTHLASTFGGGLMRSTGDFFVTALFGLLFALALLDYAARFLRQRADLPEGRGGLGRLRGLVTSPGRLVAGFTLASMLALGLMVVLAALARHTVLDSTLDFFAREDLFPRSLTLLLFCTLLVLTLSVVILIISLGWMVMGSQPVREDRVPPWPSWMLGPAILAALGGPLAVFYVAFDGQALVAWPDALAFLVVGFGLAAWGFARPGSGLGWLTLRSVLPTIFVLSMLLYPLFYSGLAELRRLRMEHAAESFDQGHDPGLLFSVKEVLDQARSVPTVASALIDTANPARRRDHLDSLAQALLRGSLLSSLGSYDVSLVFLDTAGQPLGRYDVSDESLSQRLLEQSDAQQFDMLQRMYADGSQDILVEPLTGRLDPDRFQYAGIVAVRAPGQAEPVGWIMAQAEPHALLHEANTPFLRVLLPAGYTNLYADLSLAVFRNGVLVRSFGNNFGRYRLDEAVRKELVTQSERWRAETVKERRFLTYYRRERAVPSASPILEPVEHRVVAVRASAITTFDHLYYLLRLTVAGLLVGLPFYGIGLYLRRQAGLLPAPRVRFRDKVLNAFLIVGIIAVTAVGFVGVQVVTEENDRAVQSWLRQHLQRVEETLALEAQGDEMPYSVLERTRIDSLAARVGLDLNLYQDGRLINYSRPQLIQERLIDDRLPIQAYEALNLDGYQFTFVEEQLGSFTYTAGYRALLDEQGQPRYIISVPTLPEQERIEEERARTVAYLFGALLALVVLVMGTASLLADALARPIARLREGLEDVARGRFERMLPVETNDEVGELVETFNEMQAQLAESRRQLTQHERQLAWREMARQVAHEIKNPLTPMKLSVQHLRRAYGDIETTGDGAAAGDDARRGRFASLFERITATLVEQIDSLARIANEFSSFARMPTQMLERLDLNAVVREAVALMQEEAGIDLALDLAAEPLVLEADREELRRIYINLIKNALQALHDDGEGRVLVSTRREPAHDGRPAYAYSTVTDTGHGIPADLRDKIFEPNFSTKTSGTGLGLAIAQRSIEAFDGVIGFETDEGHGTTFWIRLPLVE